MLELDTSKQLKSAEVITDCIKAERKPKKEKPTDVILFQNIADQYLNEQLALGNRDIYITDGSRLKRFYEFTKGKPIEFSMITVELLRRYTLFLRTSKNTNCKKEPKPLSERTVINHLLITRTLLGNNGKSYR